MTTEERREYLRIKKQESRARARAEGRCIVCTTTPVTDTVVCSACVNRSVEWERQNGWRKKPANPRPA